MKCPYTNPTVQQCENCPLPDCVRSESADAQVYVREWKKRNPDKVREYERKKRENFTVEKKQSELQRLNEWKAKNPSKVKRSIKRYGKRWRKAHRKEERERSRMNHQKKKVERVS